ncbi:MAG: RluA family pseudouridine synthase [Candidatus Omnitrophica bacterium]|nr:RluA family pseudouridine synthase [Candidatus Omnitrophota bacterium]
MKPSSPKNPAPPSAQWSVSVKADARLLPFLLEYRKDLKRTGVKQLLKFGSVTVNGSVVTSHLWRLKPGDRVGFLTKKVTGAIRAKSQLPFRIIHEEERFWVVDKPAGLLTIATEQEEENTLYWKLTDYAREVGGPNARVFVVHRIDRDTSGLVVFARNLETKLHLQKNWDRSLKKYLAVVEGVPVRKEATLRGRLAENRAGHVYAPRDHRRGRDSKPDSKKEGKFCVTRYKLIASTGRYSLLDITLGTGRKNQIRAHLSEHHHPVAGDFKYGAKSSPLKRLGLHACRLEFNHPEHNRRIKFTSPAPPDFSALFPRKDKTPAA